MTLEELVIGWRTLEIGVQHVVDNNFCRYCGSTDLVFTVKLRAVYGSLAGAQPKTSARAWPFLRCNGCAHESAGKMDD